MHQKKSLSDSGSDSASDSNSSSGSGSDSDSGSASSSSANSGNSSKSQGSRKVSDAESRHSDGNCSPNEEINDNADEWYEKSDELSIRRSSRSRKEPERLKVTESNSGNRSNSSNRNSRSSNNWNSSDNISDSDSDVNDLPPPPSRRPGIKKPISRRVLQKSPANNRKRSNYLSESSECSDGSDEENSRAISRRTAAASVSYKEASEDGTDSEDLLEVAEQEKQEIQTEPEEKCETIERVLDQRRGKIGVTGNQTTLYAVEDNGDPNADVDVNDLENTELQYLIKWKDWAHIHNTWESEQSLKDQKVKGIKKLENFIKKDIDIQFWRKHTAGPEDIDYYECQLELVQDLLKSYYNVERIIAKYDKPDGAGIDYYCKWESLPYSEATWEDSSLIVRKWPEKVNEFQSREESKTTPSRHCKVLKYRYVDLKSLSLLYTGSEIHAPLKMSYHCTRSQKFNMTEEGYKPLSVLQVSQLQVEAFHEASNKNFSEAADCDAIDTPDVVPIAVGCALAALVIIVLVAYLVGRRRSQARGYLSMNADDSGEESIPMKFLPRISQCCGRHNNES